jgi:hypothetical protein
MWLRSSSPNSSATGAGQPRANQRVVDFAFVGQKVGAQRLHADALAHLLDFLNRLFQYSTRRA